MSKTQQPAFLAFFLPPLSPHPDGPVFSPAFNWRHLAVLPVSFKKPWNSCWNEAKQKPGRRPSPLLPAQWPLPSHTASWSTVLISGDTKQTQRRNYKHQRQRPTNSWVTDSSCANGPSLVHARAGAGWGRWWAAEDLPLPPLLRPQAALCQVVRELVGQSWVGLHPRGQGVWRQSHLSPIAYASGP